MSARSAQAQDACPDPSAHSKDAKLQNSASKAALLATSSQKTPSNPLGADGKLSSASAAASLKYAQPHDLPSFPSVGIDTGTSGNRAANLANANQKPFEHWKPELSSSASKAALLAHKDGGKLDLWQPSSSDAGLSAAGRAMGINSSPQLDYGYTEDGRKKALLAATLSVSGRAKSPEKPAQTLYPDQENAQHNALNAASVANRPSTRTSEYGPVSDPANEAARLSHGINFNKAMYGEKPPVEIELEEQRYQAALRASSISVAKQMQEVQARKSEDQYYAGLTSDDKAHASRTGSKNTPDNIRAQALGYINLQEAAQKLAAERLKKLDPDGVLAYREHWGAGTYSDSAKEKEKEKETSPRAKLSSRAQRFLSSSRSNDDEADFSSDDEADEAEAQKIRNKMRGINTELAEIDAKKRETDRAALLAAAQKSVKARMANMDERVFRETGKASPALMAEWEEKARAKAAENNEERMKNYGKVHIGGGQYMDQSELDAIAQKRMQPMLDEINDNAEKQRARDVEIAQDVEQRKYQADLQKAKDREEKAEKKRQKEDEKMQAAFEKNQKKAEAAELKREQKAKDDAEKAKWKEFKESEKAQKRAEKEEAKRAKEAEKQAEKERKEEEKASKAATAAAVGAGAGAGAGAAAATEQHDHEQGHITEAQPETSQLGELTVESTATRAAHDESSHDPPGIPTRFDDETAPAATEETGAEAATGAAAVTAAEPDSKPEPEPQEPEPEVEHSATEPITQTPVTKSTADEEKASELEPVHEKEEASASGEAEAGAAAAVAALTGATVIPATEHATTEDETAPATTSATSPDRQSKRRSFLEKFRRSKHEEEPSPKTEAATAPVPEEPRKASTEKSSGKSSEKSGFEFPSIRKKSKNQGREPGLLTKFRKAVNDPNEDHVPEGTSATQHPLKAVDKSELGEIDTGPSILTKIKQTINDPGEFHNPERGAATEHQMQSVDHSAATHKVGAHSPSPEMSPVAEETDDAARKHSVESQPFQEAKDRLSDEPITALPSASSTAHRGSESKFHEEV